MFSLVVFFSAFLLIFNISAAALGAKENVYPFSISENNLRANISNATLANAPIVIHPLPYVDELINISIWCGLEAVKSGEKIKLNRDFLIPGSRKCDHMMIEAWPARNTTSLWIKYERPLQNVSILSIKSLFSAVFLLSLFIFYKKGKAASTQRSTIVIIFASVLILDPFSYFLKFYFPNLSLHLSNILFNIGLWKISSELFAEYSPLVRKTYGLFKYLPVLPPLFLVFLFFFGTDFASSEVLTLISVLVGVILPILSIWFIFMAGNTTGSFALAIQIFSGVFVITSIFFIRFLKMTDQLFQTSFVAEAIEFSLVAGFSIFQLVFKTGESVEEEAMGHLPHVQVRRYDKIDEILNSLVAEDETVKFGDDDDTADSAKDKDTE